MGLRKREQQERTSRLLADMKQRHRRAELAADPSNIPGMTQTELNAVINSETIPTALLHDVLNQSNS